MIFKGADDEKLPCIEELNFSNALPNSTLQLTSNQESQYNSLPDLQETQIKNGTLLVQQLNIARPQSAAETAGPKNSFYLEIDEDNQSEQSDDLSTSGCGSLDPIYYSISSMSAKHSWIINEAFESDLEDFTETGSGYTTPEKRVTPPLPRRSPLNVNT